MINDCALYLRRMEFVSVDFRVELELESSISNDKRPKVLLEFQEQGGNSHFMSFRVDELSFVIQKLKEMKKNFKQ